MLFYCVASLLLAHLTTCMGQDVGRSLGPSPRNFIGPQGGSKCYVCEFDSSRCPILSECPGNRDYCTVNKFEPWTVQTIDCPGGCETFLVTDPTGNIAKWKRGCALSPLSIGSTTGTNLCVTEYNFGIRIDKCNCNGYLCNGGHFGLARGHLVTVSFTFIFGAIFSRFCRL